MPNWPRYAASGYSISSMTSIVRAWSEVDFSLPSETLGEIQEFAMNCMGTGNHDRPNKALGGITQNRNWRLPLHL